MVYALVDTEMMFKGGRTRAAAAAGLRVRERARCAKTSAHYRPLGPTLCPRPDLVTTRQQGGFGDISRSALNKASW